MGVGGRDRILLDDEDTLAKEVGKDGDAVGFRDEHGDVGCRGVEKRLDMRALIVFFTRKHEKRNYYEAKLVARDRGNGHEIGLPLFGYLNSKMY